MVSDEYWKGRYEEATAWKNRLQDELSSWKLAFGWVLAAIIGGLFLSIIF
tara:strand:- start:3605 stop:3754 length:150 start_codon:yes stop_codon:yes gene_type:complete